LRIEDESCFPQRREARKEEVTADKHRSYFEVKKKKEVHAKLAKDTKRSSKTNALDILSSHEYAWPEFHLILFLCKFMAYTAF